eukprot:scaffold26870_cov59-Phaeocystis_antarctica.AAC.4
MKEHKTAGEATPNDFVRDVRCPLVRSVPFKRKTETPTYVGPIAVLDLFQGVIQPEANSVEVLELLRAIGVQRQCTALEALPPPFALGP